MKFLHPFLLAAGATLLSSSCFGLSRLDLLRRLEQVPRQESTQTPEQQSSTKIPESTPQAASVLPVVAGKIPPMPTEPADLTPQQKRMFSTIKNLKPGLQNEGALYTKSAAALIDIVDGKRIGTDHRTIITGRIELQLLLLHVTLSGLSKNAIEAIPLTATFSVDDRASALKKGAQLIEELYANQWNRLQLHLLPEADAYKAAAKSQYESFFNQQIGIGDQSILSSFSKALQEINPIKPFTVGLGAQVKELWSKVLSLARINTHAREVAQSLPKNLPETMSKQDRDALEDVYKSALSNADEIAPNPSDEEAFKAHVQEALNDIENREDPEVELARIGEEIALIVFENYQSFEQDKSLQQELFVEPLFLKQELPSRFTRLADIVTLQLQQSILNPAVAAPALKPFVMLPQAFFTGLKNALEKQHLLSSDRDTLRNAGMTLAQLIVDNYGRCGLTATNRDAAAQLLQQFDGLSVALESEKNLHTSLTALLRDIKLCLPKIAEEFKATLPTTFVPVTGDSYLAMKQRRAEKNATALTARTPDFYAVLLREATQLLTANTAAISSTELLYNTLLVNQETLITEEDVPQKVRNAMNSEQLQATNAFFSARDAIEHHVSAHTGKSYSTYQLSATELELATPMTMLIQAVFVDFPQSNTVKPQLFQSNDEFTQCATALNALAALMAQEWRYTTVKESIRLRKLFYPQIQTVVSALSKHMVREDNEKRYLVADLLAQVTHGFLQAEGLDSPEHTTLLAAEKMARDLALASSNERSMYETLKRSIAQLKSLISHLTAQGAAQTTTISLDDPVRRQYTQVIAILAEFFSKSESRKMIGANFMLSELFFDRESGVLTIFKADARPGDATLIVDDIPEGLSPEGTKATLSFLKEIKDNPNDLQYAQSSTRQALEIQLKQLIKDASFDDLTDKMIQNQDVEKLYQALQAAAANLKNRSTYADAAMTLYQLVKKDDIRDYIKEESIISSYFFSPKCLFALPDGVSLDEPQTTGLDPIALQAGLSLFEEIKKNPRDFGYKGALGKSDPLTTSLIEKVHAFFQSALSGTPPAVKMQAITAVEDKKALAAEQTTTTTDSALIQFKVYLQANASKVREEKMFLDIMLTAKKALSGTFNGGSKREKAAADQEIFDLIFSQNGKQGLLVDPSELPRLLSKDAVEAGIELYEEILLENPKDFGYAVSKSNTNETNSHLNMIITSKLKALIAELKRRQAEMRKPDFNNEDLSLYKPIPNPNTGQARTGFVFNLMPFRDFGDPRHPETGMGPQLTEESLKKNKWSLRQVDLYKYLYKDGFKMMRARTVSIFRQAVITLDAMTKELDKDETIPIQMLADLKAKLSRKLSLRRILNKRPLENAFHIAVLGISYLPEDINDEKWEEDKEKLIIPFFEYLKKNPRKFELKQEQVAKVEIILGWLKNDNAPTPVQDYFNDNSGQMDPMMMGMGMMNPMMGMGMMGGMGMTGKIDSKTAQSLGMSSSDAKTLNATARMTGAAMNPMMMGMMNPMMMGGMGMMDPMMMAGGSGGSVNSTALRVLGLQSQMQMMNMSQKFEQRFADLKAKEEGEKTRNEIASLKKQLQAQQAKQDEEELIERLKAELSGTSSSVAAKTTPRAEIKTSTQPTQRASERETRQITDVSPAQALTVSTVTTSVSEARAAGGRPTITLESL